jgi:class 3 adenylate cyclase
MAAKNLAIMLTDIKGFTARTSESTREGMVSLLAEHDRLLLPVFRYFDGTVVKTIGDAFLVRFDSTTDAVLAGLAVQEVLRQHNAFVKDDKDRLEVRVAINAGDVELKDGDILGEPVNVTARLEAITEAGEVWFTETVYLSMNRKEVPSAEVGERVFKGIPQAVRVYKVIHDPNSEQAKNLAEGVRLTKDGPVLKGLREPHKRAKTWIAWAAAGIAGAALAAVLLVANPFKADPVALAVRESAARMARGECLSALEVLDVELKTKPGDARLVEASLKAAEAHLDFLLRERDKAEALEWIQKAIEQRPTLEPLRKRIPPLDADVTVHRLYEKKRHTDDMWAGIRDLLKKYPKDPDVPVIIKKILEKWFIPEAGLWLLEEAVKRGKDPADPAIQDTLAHVFTDNLPEEDAKYAHEFARKHCDALRLPWAKKALDEGSGNALLNAFVVLEEKKDPAATDPYYRALRSVFERKGLDEACKALTAVEDTKRGARARQIVKETIDKGSLKPEQEQVLLPAMDALVKKWGPAPAAKKEE